MLLATVGEIASIIGVGLSILTVLIIPLYKWTYAQRKEQERRGQSLEEISRKVDNINKDIKDIKKEQSKFNEFCEEYDEFFVQNLKYMINDSYVDYHNLAEIPDEKLINACECCEIYVTKKHLNHEIRPRCEQLWKERERRSVIMQNQEDNNGK